MTRDTEIFPYYFPTTVVFVDDNAGFLRGLELKLPQELAYVLYESPRRALQRLRQPSELPPLYQRCFSHYRNSTPEAEGERLIHLDLSLIEREISNPMRFTEISTVFVDYDMPAMDGLELCERIDNPYVRKVMLTGVADEKVAVAAFNEGLIHRFINKSDPDAIDKIRDALVDMQGAYFRGISEMLRSSLMLGSPGFLADREFAAFFAELRGRERFVEYYLVDDPHGFLLLRDTGELSRLVVHHQAECSGVAARARAQGAPRDICEEIESGRSVAWFYETIDSFLDAEPYEWRDYVHPARQVGQWRYALIDQPPADIDFEPEQACYRAYLERLDAEFIASR